MVRLLLPLALLVGLIAKPVMAQNQFEVLVVAVSSEYHFEYTSVARDSFRKLADEHQFGLEFATYSWALDADLSKYDAIVLLNTNASSLSESQRSDFQQYVRSGKGVVCVHRTIGLEEDWPWFTRMTGRAFINHPMIQTAMLDVEDHNFPATAAMPDRFFWTDEWYVTEPQPDVDLHVVLSVDESTYDPTRIWPGQTAEPMGEHPVSWYHNFEGSRIFTTTLGHIPAAYADPVFLNHIYGGLYWAATGKGIDQNGDSVDPSPRD